MAEHLWDGSTDGALDKDANYVEDSSVATGDVILFGSSAISTVDVDGGDYTGTANDWAAVDLDGIEVRDGCALNFGSFASGVVTPVQIDMGAQTNRTFIQRGTGNGYWEVTNCARADIYRTGPSTTQSGVLTKPGIDLRGATWTEINIEARASDVVGLSWFEDIAGSYTALTATTVKMQSGVCYVGDNATITNIDMWGGELHLHAGTTTLDLHKGTVYIYEGAQADINQYGGLIVYIGTGTITNLLGKGGRIDFDQGAGTVVVTNAIEAYAGYTILNTKGRAQDGSSNLAPYKANQCSVGKVNYYSPIDKTVSFS